MQNGFITAHFSGAGEFILFLGWFLVPEFPTAICMQMDALIEMSSLMIVAKGSLGGAKLGFIHFGLLHYNNDHFVRKGK